MMKYTFKCDICNAVFERFIEAHELKDEETDVHLYQEFPINWSFVRGVTICSRHTIVANTLGLYVDSALLKVS